MMRTQRPRFANKINKIHIVTAAQPVPWVDLARLSLFSGSNDDGADPGVPGAEVPADASDELSDRPWRCRY